MPKQDSTLPKGRDSAQEPAWQPAFDQAYPGQASIQPALIRWLQHPEMPTLLLTGAVGSGRHALARWLAAGLLCQTQTRDAKEGACGHCQSCQLFKAETHPDLHMLEAEEGERTLKVDALRQKLISDLALKPQFSARKVYIIEGEELNEAGQNVLLKSLEEAPPYAFFILLAQRKESLLPTIISRAMALQLEATPDEQIQAALLQAGCADEALRSAITKQASGRIAQALQDWQQLLQRCGTGAVLADYGPSQAQMLARKLWELGRVAPLQQVLIEGWSLLQALEGPEEHRAVLDALSGQCQQHLQELLQRDGNPKQPSVLSLLRLEGVIEELRAGLKHNSQMEIAWSYGLLRLHGELHHV